MKVITKNSKETIAFGKKFAKTLNGGEVLLLIGDLGAGKTTFAKGVAEGLGVKEMVNSPTFVIMKIYKTQSPKHLPRLANTRVKAGKAQSKLKIQNPKFKGVKVTTPYSLPPTPLFLVHIDTYRGIDLIGLENIGALEYFGREDSVCLVEWGAGLADYLRKKKIQTKTIKIQMDDENKRTINIK